MNISTFMQKLLKGHYHEYLKIKDGFIHCNFEMSCKDFANNLDVLARELHMEVEENTRKAYEELQNRVKHDWIEVDDLVKELEDEK